jgi:hypothetical protein
MATDAEIQKFVQPSPRLYPEEGMDRARQGGSRYTDAARGEASPPDA